MLVGLLLIVIFFFSITFSFPEACQVFMKEFLLLVNNKTEISEKLFIHVSQQILFDCALSHFASASCNEFVWYFCEAAELK